MAADVIRQVKNMMGDPTKLGKGRFTQSENTSGERSEIARYEAPRHLYLRPDRPVSITVVAFEEFTTDGDADSDTYSLSADLIQSPNAPNLVLYSDGTRVDPDSIDYDANSFDYTDGGSAEDLDVYYMARDPGNFEIVKEAPKSQGKQEDTVFEEATSIINETDQLDRPFELEVDESELQKIVPENWDIVVYADVPYQIVWVGDGTAGSGEDTSASNLNLSIPAAFINGNIPGLSKAVAQDIIDRKMR